MLELDGGCVGSVVAPFSFLGRVLENGPNEKVGKEVGANKRARRWQEVEQDGSVPRECRVVIVIAYRRWGACHQLRGGHLGQHLSVWKTQENLTS